MGARPLRRQGRLGNQFRRGCWGLLLVWCDEGLWFWVDEFRA